VTHRNAFIFAAVLAGAYGCSAEEPASESAEVVLSSPIAVAASGGNPAAEAAAAQITDEYMREIIAEISSDAYEGRGPASAGDEKARAYLATRMLELGLEPGADDGSFQQYFDLVSVTSIQPETWEFESGGKSLSLKQWDQFLINSNVQEPRVEVSNAEVVFAGYGIQAPEYDGGDYR